MSALIGILLILALSPVKPNNFIDNCIENLHHVNEIVYGDKTRQYGSRLRDLHHVSEHKRNPPHIFKRK